MRFLVKFSNYKLTLNIEQRFKTDSIVIPIGYDCHPANMLNALKLRTQSLPFDWLNMDPIQGIGYVAHNIKTGFKDFLKDLRLNENGYVVSSAYPSSEFMHEKDLIENPDTKEKLLRRCERFIKILNEERCQFLYNIPSYSVDTEERVIQFTNNVREFLKQIKEDDKLLIYLRYDESFEENKIFCEGIYDVLKSLKNITVRKYLREKERFGIWGDQNKYPEFFRTICNNFKSRIPKVYFS